MPATDCAKIIANNTKSDDELSKEISAVLKTLSYPFGFGKPEKSGFKTIGENNNKQ